MTKYSISIDLEGLSDSISQIVDETIFPLVSQAVMGIAQAARNEWIEAVQRAHLWSGEKSAYSESIKLEKTGPFSAVVSASYKYAGDIETGRPPRDLKKMLDTSTKVRRTQDGRRFLVIPFRHNTPGNDALADSMPDEVYAIASELSPSTVIGQTQRPSGEITGFNPKLGMAPAKKQSPFLSNPKSRKTFMVAQNIYNWGDTLPKMAQGKKYEIYAGMKRMDASAGGARYSEYLTFRIMMEGSPGWIVPAKEGLYLAKGVADKLQPLAEKIMQEAMARMGR